MRAIFVMIRLPTIDSINYFLQTPPRSIRPRNAEKAAPDRERPCNRRVRRGQTALYTAPRARSNRQATPQPPQEGPCPPPYRNRSPIRRQPARSTARCLRAARQRRRAARAASAPLPHPRPQSPAHRPRHPHPRDRSDVPAPRPAGPARGADQQDRRQRCATAADAGPGARAAQRRHPVHRRAARGVAESGRGKPQLDLSGDRLTTKTPPRARSGVQSVQTAG